MPFHRIPTILQGHVQGAQTAAYPPKHLLRIGIERIVKNVMGSVDARVFLVDLVSGKLPRE